MKSALKVRLMTSFFRESNETVLYNKHYGFGGIVVNFDTAMSLATQAVGK